MDKAHAHGACSQMRHGMCVRRQLIWRRPELETQACRSLPLQKRDSVESSVRWAENFGAQEMPMRREGIVAVHCR